MTERLQDVVSEASLAEIDEWIAKYPAEERQSAVMRALMVVQETHGHLSTSQMDAVAEYLQMPPIAVYEMATFYSMYELEPIGKHLIGVCTNISCKLKGSNKIVSYLEKKLGISLGQTTSDKQYTLREVECLGACVNAPMMSIGKDYHEHLTSEKIDDILRKL